MKPIKVIFGPYTGLVARHYAKHGKAIEIKVDKKKTVIVHSDWCEVLE